MSWPYEAYLTLLTDLLSPGELPRGTLASVVQQFGAVEDAGLAKLVSAMLQSPSLFGLSTAQDPSSSTQTYTAVSLEAARNVFHAVRQGMLIRIQEVKESKGSAWSKRRRLQKSLHLLHTSISESSSGQQTSEAMKTMVVTTAILRGFQDAAADKDPFIHPDSSLLYFCERNTVASISECIKLLSVVPTACLPDNDTLITAWHVAQVLPEIPSERLVPLADTAFFDLAFAYVRSCFLDGHILDDMSVEVYEKSSSIIWPEDCSTSQRLKAVKGSISHALLGRFSRSLGKVIESVHSTDSLLLLLPRLEQLESMAERIHRAWAACIWSSVSGAEELHANTRNRDEPWTIFKTLLFTLTMIFSSLISLMNAMPLLTNHSPNKTILDLAACAVRTFQSIYFITSKFGTGGFGAYQNAWYGAIDLINRAQPPKVEQIVKMCEPHYGHTEGRAVVLSKTLPRSRLTYWLILIEQLASSLPEEYISVTVIPALRPYLTNKQDLEAFESAHSVLLAIFRKRKLVSLEVARQYTDLLLVSYPDLLSISQLRLAFAGMVSCLTDLGSPETEVCMTKLIEAIELCPPGPSLWHSAQLPLADVSTSQAGQIPSLASASTVGPSAKAIEASALKSRRGHLLLVLIDQLSTVTLEKMDELLPTVQALLHEEKRAPRESRAALVQVLFNTLSGGMDMIKRESAAKWWLQHRSEIEAEENLPEGNDCRTKSDTSEGQCTVARL